MQDTTTRDYVLTNIDIQNGQYCWTFNLSALEANIDDIIGFPQFTNSYEGRTLFIGGQKSPFIR